MNTLTIKTFSGFLLFLILCMPGYCQVKTLPQAQATKNEDTKLTRASIEKNVKDMSNLIINGYTGVTEKDGSENSKVLSSLLLKQYEDQYKIFYSLPEIEKMTGYSREWFGKLLKTVQELNKCSNEVNVAIVRLQPETIEPLKKKYDDLRKVYRETYEKPEKAKP